jgi:acetoin utilization protein AcuB
MQDKPVSIPPHASVDEAARLMHHHAIGALPVVDHGRLVGILTRTDILSAFIDLSGVAEPTYRMILSLPAEKGTAAQIRRIVDRCHGEVKWIHLETRKSPPQAHLRVSIRFIDNLAAALEGAGFEVTAIVAPSPHPMSSESAEEPEG